MKLLTPFLPHVAGGLLLVLLIMTGLWRFEARRVDVVKGERDAAQHQVTQLQAAVDGKDATITTMQKAAAAWQNLATPAAAMTAAAARMQATAEEIEARSRALTTAEEKDHDLPDCAALLALDLALACPGHARSVRDRAAASGLRRSSGGGSGAGGAEGGRPPDR